MRRHGQAAMEYMMIFGFSLVILGILWIYSGSNINDTRWELQSSYAKSALNKISQTAELVYIQGPPSEFYIYPTFPDNVQSVYVSGDVLALELRWKGGILRNISVETSANVTGILSIAPGTHKVLVKSFIGFVNITDV